MKETGDREKSTIENKGSTPFTVGVMKRGDIIRYHSFVIEQGLADKSQIYLVRRVEEKNSWVFVFGQEIPIQMSLMVVISES